MFYKGASDASLILKLSVDGSFKLYDAYYSHFSLFLLFPECAPGHHNDMQLVSDTL